MTRPATGSAATRRRAWGPEANGSIRVVLADLVRCPSCWAVFLGVAAGVSLLYTLLLPYAFTQRLSAANWHFLTGGLLAWSLLLGIGMGLVVTVQVHAIRQLAASRPAALGGLALLGAALPSLLCCSPIIPTVLSFLGVTTVSLFGVTGALQHFFAVHEIDFLAGSLVVLAASAWWALHGVARSACLAGNGCMPEPASAAPGDGHVTPGSAADDAKAHRRRGGLRCGGPPERR